MRRETAFIHNKITTAWTILSIHDRWEQISCSEYERDPERERGEHTDFEVRVRIVLEDTFSAVSHDCEILLTKYEILAIGS
jgi:hypothetical protein